MDKAQLPVVAELSLGADTQDSTLSTSARKFNWPKDPGQRKVLQWMLAAKEMSREAVDIVAGVSNGPHIIYLLRKQGLEMPCKRVLRRDRDGRACYPGVYYLTPADNLKVRLAAAEWSAK